ncbi:DNA repair protein [uncultured Tateyamaria sp.]|uniref:DNA repair protein n=1 Tax=uncultured Tateyamaria sp. TaxID=455651 RepID=UPI002629397B|nr:DNA repair protein [uncultured Tateyamaria sp.]
MNDFKSMMRVCIALMQRLSLVLFAALAFCLVTLTMLATFGAVPWVTLPLEWNGAAIPAAGIYAQVGLTLFALSLCFFLPANWRMMRLEDSHRRFELGVNDITRAYHAAHAADRDGVFRTEDAFDDMRDRIGYMRDHPDLGRLEPEILDLAAKMSFISRDLAEAYSDERISRARSFLKEREYEIDRFNDRLAHAKAIQSEFSTWITRIELDENVARAQVERLLDELETMLPELNKPHAPVAAIQGTAKVTQLPKRAE